MGITADFLKKCAIFIRQGEGFLKNAPIDIHNFCLGADGALLTTTLSTNPGFVAVNTNILSFAWAADKVVAAGLAIQVPDDYDSAKDHLKLLLKAKMGGTTNTTTAIAAAAYKNESTTDLGITQTADLTDHPVWVELDLSGHSLVAGDNVSIKLTPEAHGTDAIYVTAAKLEYRSTLVYADHNGSR
jgi:hypothetical protein